MIKLLYIISTVLLFISCGNKGDIKKDLELLKSKYITLPTDIEFFVYREDSVVNFMSSELKLIVYADSVSCGSCAIKTMYMWEEFLEYAEKFNNRLKYYFIFSPKKNDEYSVKFALKNALFDYPLILDSKKQFENLNPHLPKNKAMHTFLLDKDNK